MGGVVGGLVVHEDDLDVAVRLREVACHGRADVARFVSRGNDDRYQRAVVDRLLDSRVGGQSPFEHCDADCRNPDCRTGNTQCS